MQYGAWFSFNWQSSRDNYTDATTVKMFKNLHNCGSKTPFTVGLRHQVGGLKNTHADRLYVWNYKILSAHPTKEYSFTKLVFVAFWKPAECHFHQTSSRSQREYKSEVFYHMLLYDWYLAESFWISHGTVSSQKFSQSPHHSLHSGYITTGVISRTKPM